MGSVSAAITTNSEIPLFRVLVAASTAIRVQPPVRNSSDNMSIQLRPTFIGPLSKLLVVGRLLDDVHNGVRQLQGR